VLAKIVTRAPQPFITAVTINTNRQNPVEPANLRASDQIQLELQDKFRDELNGLLYERQESLFASLSEQEMTELGFDPGQSRAIEIKRLAKTSSLRKGRSTACRASTTYSKPRVNIARVSPRNI
jgi:hypothetical protein